MNNRNTGIFDIKDIWFWYGHIEGAIKSKLNKPQYCELNKLNYATFNSRIYRINYCKFSNPTLYEKVIPIAKKLYEERLPASRQNAKKYGLTHTQLSAALTHIRYISIIEDLKLNPPEIDMETIKKNSVSILDEKSNMNFHQVKNKTNELNSKKINKNRLLGFPLNSNGFSPESPEIIESKNDIEINIAKGVKVSIAPNIEPLKIIKIIELLKDL